MAAREKRRPGEGARDASASGADQAAGDPSRPARAREGARRADDIVRPANAGNPARDRAPEENSIRPMKRRLKEAPFPAAASGQGSLLGHDQVREDRPPAVRPPAGAAAPAESSADTVPEEIRRRFVQVGRTYYFPDGARAFNDRGRRLTTSSENTEVIRSLVAIAQARGWSEVTVSGTERFRKEAWTAARLAGLAARGYAPSEFERQHLARSLARKDASTDRSAGDAAPATMEEARDAERGAKRDRHGTLLLGRLVDHGHATYKHDPHQPISYFVKLETGRGERTIWGVDLERAFRESLTRPKAGDEVGLRAVRRELVTVKAQERDAAGRAVGLKDLATHRNRWIVEKREFFEARAEAARTVRDPKVEARRAVHSHPELAGTYLYLRGAEEIASKRIRDPEDQKKFVALVRGALADSVERGEPLPPVRVRDRPARPERTVEREPARTR